MIISALVKAANLWDNKNNRFDEVDFDEAEEFCDSDHKVDITDDQGHVTGTRYLDVYARIGFRDGKKVSSVYLATEDDKEAAFGEAESSERKGTVESIKDGKLKFKTSSTEYTLASKYDEDDLKIGGAQTKS